MMPMSLSNKADGHAWPSAQTVI